MSSRADEPDTGRRSDPTGLKDWAQAMLGHLDARIAASEAPSPETFSALARTQTTLGWHREQARARDRERTGRVVAMVERGYRRRRLARRRPVLVARRPRARGCGGRRPRRRAARSSARSGDSGEPGEHPEGVAARRRMVAA